MAIVDRIVSEEDVGCWNRGGRVQLASAANPHRIANRRCCPSSVRCCSRCTPVRCEKAIQCFPNCSRGNPLRRPSHQEPKGASLSATPPPRARLGHRCATAPLQKPSVFAFPRANSAFRDGNGPNRILIAAPFVFWQQHVYLMRYSLAAVLLAAAGLWLLPAFAGWCDQKQRPQATYFAISAFTLAAAITLLNVVFSGPESLFAAVKRLTASSPLAETVSELQSLTRAKGFFSLEYPWHEFGGAFVLTIVGLPLLAEATWKKPNPKHTLFLVWAATFFLMAMTQARMTFYFAVSAALLAGYLMSQLPVCAPWRRSRLVLSSSCPTSSKRPATPRPCLAKCLPIGAKRSTICATTRPIHPLTAFWPGGIPAIGSVPSPNVFPSPTLPKTRPERRQTSCWPPIAKRPGTPSMMLVPNTSWLIKSYPCWAMRWPSRASSLIFSLTPAGIVVRTICSRLRKTRAAASSSAAAVHRNGESRAQVQIYKNVTVPTSRER